MIKLEDLHKEDIIYQVCNYYWIEKIKITKDLKNNITDYYIEGRGTFNLQHNNFKMYEELNYCDEDSLYRTYNEAIEAFNKSKQNRILYLQKDNNLLKELYKETVNKGMHVADEKIFKQLIDNCIISFNIKK